MKPRLHLALVAALLSAGSATALPALKGDVTISRAVVTVGDMFEDAGMFAETGIFLAPAPGTTGIVPLADVQRAAARIGLTDFDNVGFTRVRVIRPSVLVDATTFDALIENELRRQGIVTGSITADVRYSIADVSLNAEAVDSPARLTGLQHTPGSRAFSARFEVAGIDQPVVLGGSIELMTEAPRLRTSLPAGTVLGAGDFEMAAVPLTLADAGSYAGIDQLLGKQLVRQARAGLMLKATDVSEPKVVARNSLVTVLLRNGPMTLTVRGTALTTAAAGEPVDVLNSVTRKIVHGIARPDGTVEIVTATNVAGL